jgi:hypothetical protein
MANFDHYSKKCVRYEELLLKTKEVLCRVSGLRDLLTSELTLSSYQEDTQPQYSQAAEITSSRVQILLDLYWRNVCISALELGCLFDPLAFLFVGSYVVHTGAYCFPMLTNSGNICSSMKYLLLIMIESNTPFVRLDSIPTAASAGTYDNGIPQKIFQKSVALMKLYVESQFGRYFSLGHHNQTIFAEAS